MSITKYYKIEKSITNLRFLSLAVLISLLSIGPKGFSQKTYPTDYFRSPLDIPLILSGSFAELRSNHFHSGLDIKTQGVTGKNVYAIADGYVSRIKVSAYGYGNALYVRHPNGYTSVYAHLDRYNDTLEMLIEKTQYQQKSFEVEVFPSAGSYPVKKGDLIAKSGNSGSSGGPHLHFEIRDSGTEEPINPLYFGYKFADHQPPSVRKLRIYHLQDINYPRYSEYALQQNGSKVSLRNSDTLAVYTNRFYPAVEGFDRFDGATNQNGYYRLSYYFDDSLFFQFVADRINFSQQRFINSYIDYKSFKQNSIRFQRSYVEPNNKSDNMQNVIQNGIVQLNDNKAHRVKVIAADFAGQESILEIWVKKQEKSIVANTSDYLFKWNQKNVFHNDFVSFTIPQGSLYNDQYFYVNTLKNPYNNYSPIMEIYDAGVPLHNYCNISILADSSFPQHLQNKACIISLDGNNRWVYEGGKYEQGRVNTKTRSFGKYFIGVDTIAPNITAQNVYNNKNIGQQSQLSFKATDNLSGIARYEARLDGQWILLKYDPKRNHLYYDMDEHFPTGNHEFVISVWDDKENMSKKSYTLQR